MNRPPPILCVNCRHHHTQPSDPPFDHVCRHPNRYTVSLVTGANVLRSLHPFYSTCEDQRAQEGSIVGDPPRCSHRGDWFEAKSPEAAP